MKYAAALFAIILVAAGLATAAYAVDPNGQCTGDQFSNGCKPNVTVVDRVWPTWFDQMQSADSLNGGDIITLSALLKDDKGLKNATLFVNEYNQTQQLSGIEQTAVFKYTIPDTTAPGTKMTWHVRFFDYGEHENDTKDMSFTVKDDRPPAIMEQTQGADSTIIGGEVLLSARITDNYMLASAVFETNETGKFTEAKRYDNLNEKDTIVSIRWSNPRIGGDTQVGWRVAVTDVAGNAKTSDVMTFKIIGCPVCPSPSEWSECAGKSAGNGTQSRTYYECGSSTKFACVLHTATQWCLPGISREEAKSAIDGAALAISSAKAENKDTTAAEGILANAQAAYDKGEWGTAKTTAASAADAAKDAVVIVVPKPNYLPYIAAVVVMLVAAGILLKFGRIHLPIASEFKPPAEAEPAKQGAGQVCGVCGRSFDKLYTCEECGTKVCFEDARTWEGKIYCINDLRKKGLL